MAYLHFLLVVMYFFYTVLPDRLAQLQGIVILLSKTTVEDTQCDTDLECLIMGNAGK